MGASGSSLSPDEQTKVSRKVIYEYEREKATSAPGTDLSGYVHERVAAHSALPEAGYQCPKVRFGRTELQMPIVTCGGMRIQETWGRKTKPVPADISGVDTACQDNLIATIRRALELGVNHFETKVSPKKPGDFKEAMEKSFRQMQVDGPIGYIDLFSFHGINKQVSLDYIFEQGGWDVVQELRDAGKIRWVGFSTHGMPDIITAAIETDKFDYVNIHYDFIGSYTASGSGEAGGNLTCLQKAQEHDMGIFIISPNDKGGKLYKPSKKFADLCAPDLDPISFNALWLWHHTPAAHTLVIGVARPTDFDEMVLATKLFDTEEGRAKVAAVEGRMVAAAHEALGQEWYENWHVGLPNGYQCSSGVMVGKWVWLWNIVKAWGLFEFAKDRYIGVMSNNKAWDDAKTFEENTADWGFMPGCCYREGVEADLEGVPDPEKVLAILKEVDGWLTKTGPGLPEELKADCAPAYDLQPDTPWPERS
mmetsp:Transcript_71947/g.203956  ORF Transcript_71947/g.203956 Transcript_71947/m.203956 type:complete len:478 (+) Transcript_71947:139-1572(+)